MEQCWYEALKCIRRVTDQKLDLCYWIQSFLTILRVSVSFRLCDEQITGKGPQQSS